MKLLKSIFIRLLYFTPLGYFLSFLNILKQNEQFGVRLNFPKQKGKSITLSVVNSPTLGMRISWLVNGLVILTQSVMGYFIFRNYDWSGTDTFGSFVAVISFSIAIGIVQIVVALFPNINWNRNL